MREDWIECKIDDLISESGMFCDGDWIESKDQDVNGSIRLIQLADIGDGIFKNKSARFLTYEKSLELKCTFLKYDDIILARMPDPLGRATIFPLNEEEKYVTVVDVAIIRTGNNCVVNKYLLYNINSQQIRQKIESLQSGSTRKRISRKNLSTIKIPLAPLPIQRAIVSKIEALFSDLDNGIANFKKAKEQLKIYRQAVLKKAFEGKLTKEWREKQTNLPTAEELLSQIKEERQNHYNQQIEVWKKAVKVWEKNGKFEKKPSKPTQPKELSLLKEKELKELPLIPDGWFYSEIGNICNCIVPNRDKPKSFSGDIKWITTPDLDEKLIKLNYSKIEIGLTKNEAEKYNARVIPINSVIMTCVGTLGLSSIVEKEIIINQQLHAFLPENYYLPKSLAYYIRLNKNFYERISTSTTIQYVNKDKCNSLPFPLCSLSEQTQIIQEIESRLSVCDKMEQSINESIEKAEALRQSILKKAFEGKLLSQAEIERCKKEADYEPASELLKKIQAEKSAKEQEKKKPRKK